MKIWKMEHLSETTYWNVPDIFCTFFKYNPIGQPITYRYCSIGGSVLDNNARDLRFNSWSTKKNLKRQYRHISKTQILQKKEKKTSQDTNPTTIFKF